MLRLLRLIWVAIVMTSVTYATQILFTDFEGFRIGLSIDGQNGWSAQNLILDQRVMAFGGNTVWRISNATTSGSFSDQPFAPRLGGIPSDTVTNPTNNSPGAFAGESLTGTLQRHFSARFNFRSALGVPQPGASVKVSADNGSGARQSFTELEDTGTGIQVVTYDFDSNGEFIEVVIASGLSYDSWHVIDVEIEFKDGPGNDWVAYFVDGSLVHTGPSWEEYYRNFQMTLHPLGVPVQTLIFRLSGPPCSSCLGGGYLIDDVVLGVY